jgi:hypothetical protein
MRTGLKPIIVIYLSLILVSLLMDSCQSKQEPSTKPITFITPTPQASVDITRQLADIKLVNKEPDPDGVELVSVGLAPEISQIMVVFKGPPDLIANWWQGSVYVIDESRNMVYKDIPLAPLIGPLIGKPQEAGQFGYAMLSNFDSLIKPGSVLTVVLGKYYREHVKVEE